MKILYIDGSMGAAGDMLTAALLELTPDPEAALAELNAMGLPGVTFRRERSVKGGISGTHMVVTVHGEEEGEGAHRHPSADLPSIRQIIGSLSLPETVRAQALAVYESIAAAESAVHGVPVEQVHFHEVGALDAVADVAAVCLLLYRLAPEEIAASPVHVGSGSVRCAHGVLPVPAPATAALLQGVPIYGGEIEGELCTPTGAALLKHFVTRFGPMPAMTLQAVGYGMGKKDFSRPNCVRVLLGEGTGASRDAVAVLSCNLDDMTGEELGFAMERLWEAGAREVFTVPVGMKKNRPGVLLEVICRLEDRPRLVETIFRHTTTIGIREARMDRYILERETLRRGTELGEVRVKRSSGYGVTREKAEYEDLARIAREGDMSLAEARLLAEETL